MTVHDIPRPQTDAAADDTPRPEGMPQRDIEAVFLGSCLLAGDGGKDALLRLSFSHFARPRWQVVFAIMQGAARNGYPLDPGTICAALPASVADGTAQDIADTLLEAGRIDPDVNRYAKQVEHAHSLRQVERIAREIQAQASGGQVADLGKFVASLPDRFAGVACSLSGNWPDLLNASAWMEEEPEVSDPIVEGCIDTGDKALIVAPSKGRKSFLALHLALAVASGRDFIGFTIPRPRRVLLVQFEIKAAKYHERLRGAAHGAGICPADLGDRLHVLNLRGRMKEQPSETLRKIAEEAKATAADLIILDPFYKLMDGDENAAHEVKPVLAILDRMAEDTGAAVLYVHHTGKGNAGDRQSIDRAVGSGVIARDFDAQFSVTPHRDYSDTDPLLVVELTARNYPPRAPFTISFDGHRFTLSDAPPIVRTSQNGPRG